MLWSSELCRSCLPLAFLLGSAAVAQASSDLRLRSIPNGYVFTILPIGDSITAGRASSDDNGYRLDLEDMLKLDRHDVEYVGSNRNGINNPDNENEGFGGMRISQILQDIQTDGIVWRQKANLILIHAGTNDNDFEITGETYGAAPDRLGVLIDYVLCQQPSAVVLVAKLIQNNWNSTQTAYFNSKVPGIVNERFTRGYKVRVVDQSTVTELSDLLHPTDIGYMHMAQNWYQAIQQVPTEWWSGVNMTAATGPSSHCGLPPLTSAANRLSMPLQMLPAVRNKLLSAQIVS